MMKKWKHVEIFRAQSWPLRWECVLNILSEGTLVAGTQRYFLATFARRGISLACIFHHASGSVSALMVGRDLYIIIADSTLSLTFSFPEVALFSLNEVICCSKPDRLFSFFLVVVVAASWFCPVLSSLCLRMFSIKRNCCCKIQSFFHTCLNCVIQVFTEASLKSGIHKAGDLSHSFHLLCVSPLQVFSHYLLPLSDE